MPWFAQRSARRALQRALAVAALMAGALLGPLSPALAQASNATPPAATASLPADIPFKRDPAPATSEEAPVAWVLVTFGAAALFFVWLRVSRVRSAAAAGPAGLRDRPWWQRWRQVMPGAAHPAEVRRVESTRLTPHHSLHVVEWNGRRLLVGCSEHSVQLLAEAGEAASSARNEAHGLQATRESA